MCDPLINIHNAATIASVMSQWDTHWDALGNHIAALVVAIYELILFILSSSGIILCMRPANGRRRYNVTSSLIGWTHTQKDPSQVENWTNLFTCKQLIFLTW